MRTSICTGAVLLALLFAAPSVRGAHRMVGGPFLTELAPHAVTVSWETKYLSRGKVDAAWPSGKATFQSEGGRKNIHHVRLTGLPADTACRYRVFLDGESLRSYTFKTAPAKPRAFRFAAYGDSQERFGGRHSAIAAAILGHKPDFVIHSGDYTTHSTRSEWTSQFFRPASDLLAQTPIVAAMGNRESGSDVFHQYFGSSPECSWRTWGYANAQVFVLNSNEDLLPDSPQHDWLDATLAASKAQWKIVVFHHPLYSGSRHGSDESLRCALMPVFLEHGVDLVIVGHDQCYERTHPIGTGDEPETNALLQVVTGGGGGRIYGVHPKVWTARAMSCHHYCILDVTDSKLTITAYNLEGEAFDSTTVVKDGTRRHCKGAIAAEAINFFDAGQKFAKLYLPMVGPGKTNKVRLRFRNPYDRDIKGSVAWKLPNKGWSIEPAACDVVVPANGESEAIFIVSFDPAVAGGNAQAPPIALLTSGSKTVAVPAFERTLRQFAAPLLSQ
ncbi:metallophosphoesterase family protein [bacterium]|nr:metallophosphoesterase family protein [bacterium]